MSASFIYTLESETGLLSKVLHWSISPTVKQNINCRDLKYVFIYIYNVWRKRNKYYTFCRLVFCTVFIADNQQNTFLEFRSVLLIITVRTYRTYLKKLFFFCVLLLPQRVYIFFLRMYIFFYLNDRFRFTRPWATTFHLQGVSMLGTCLSIAGPSKFSSSAKVRILRVPIWWRVWYTD